MTIHGKRPVFGLLFVLPLSLTVAVGSGQARKQDQWGDPLPEGAVARMGTTRVRRGSFEHIAVSPRGDLFATGSSSGEVHLWGISSGKLSDGFGKWEAESIEAMAFSHDGRHIVAAEHEALLVLDVNRRRLERRIEPKIREFYVTDVAVSPNGNRFAWSGCVEYGSDAVHLMTLGGERVRSFRGFKEDLGTTCANAVDFSPDGRYLAAGGRDFVLVWSVASGRVEARLDTDDVSVESVRFSADGRHLAAGGWNEAVNLFSTRDWTVVKSFGFFMRDGGPGHVKHIALSVDGKWLAAGFSSQVRLWSTATRKLAARFEKYNGESFAFSKDSKRLLFTMGSPPVVARVNLESLEREPSFDLPWHYDSITSVLFSADGKRLVTSGKGGTVRLWHASTGKHQGLVNLEAGVGSVARSADGDNLLTVSRDCMLGLWNCASLKGVKQDKLQVKAEHCPRVLGAAYSPTGGHAAISLANGTLHVLETATLKMRHRIVVEPPRDSSSDLTRPVFSADGKSIAVGLEVAVLVYEAGTGKQTRRLDMGEGEEDAARDVAWAPNKPLLAALSGHRVDLWDASSGELLRSFQTPIDERRGGSLRFSPDGELLVAASRDHVYVWELATGTRLIDLVLPSSEGNVPESIGAIAVGADGLIATATGSTAIVWDLSAEGLR